jgi:hypothetical protein
MTTWRPYVSAGAGSLVGDLRVLDAVASPQLGDAHELYVPRFLLAR